MSKIFLSGHKTIKLVEFYCELLVVCLFLYTCYANLETALSVERFAIYGNYIYFLCSIKVGKIELYIIFVQKLLII